MSLKIQIVENFDPQFQQNYKFEKSLAVFLTGRLFCLAAIPATFAFISHILAIKGWLTTQNQPMKGKILFFLCVLAASKGTIKTDTKL